VEETVHRLEIVEAVVFGSALLVTGVAGALWVRLSLRPLRRVSTTAAGVAELPLASGEVAMPPPVPDTDPRTEVGQVGTALNRMLGHVGDALARRQASEERLRHFSADASHELRTPVASVRGHAELALRHPGPVPDEVRHALERIQAESERMSALVDDLLLLARLDAGRPLARRTVDLTRVVLDATGDARAAGPGHHWTLELAEEPVTVLGDEHRLQQVIGNLLANARTHTPAGTRVTVRLAVADGDAELTVADDGPGVPDTLQGEVFERFARADPGRSRAGGGTGLGLAIVRAVVAAHGGTITLTSRPGATVFRARLPGPCRRSSWPGGGSRRLRGCRVGGVDTEYLAGDGVDAEGLVGQCDLADERVPEGLRAGSGGSYVVGRPARPELRAAGREFADQFGQVRVVGVAAGLDPQHRHGVGRDPVPLGEQVPGPGLVEEQEAGAVRPSGQVEHGREECAPQCVDREDVEPAVEDHCG
jgi:signal transduction histidine kinase